jgi:hypothetical protein
MGRIAGIKGIFTFDSTLTGRIAEIKGTFTFDSVLSGRIAEIKGILDLCQESGHSLTGFSLTKCSRETNR